ncbi:MAG: DUF1569 domain-containing protein [Isosphaeraceae bacterium]|nr:DUF1569 domain-containing protein [Isosphaeraceae bacterium]
MAKRRALEFAGLDQVMPDVDRLLGGHTTTGNWSLGQICNHLSESVRFSLEGFGVKAPWLLRMALGSTIKKQILKTGKMREGIKLPEKFLPKPDLDARAEAEALRASLRLFAAHTGPVADHPMFGPMTHAEWGRLHCIHCAHHLSFVQRNGV